MSGNATGRRGPDQGWWELRVRAGAQAGFFTFRLAARCGCEARVRAGLADGSVTRAGEGMLRLAEFRAGPFDEYARWTAWFDGSAVISHHSAAELFGLGRLRPRFVHLCAVSGRPPYPAEVVLLHRALAGDDVESAGAFQVTTPVRTVLDLAETGIGQVVLDEVVADAVAIHRCAAAELRSAAEGVPPRIAARVRRALIAA